MIPVSYLMVDIGIEISEGQCAMDTGIRPRSCAVNKLIALNMLTALLLRSTILNAVGISMCLSCIGALTVRCIRTLYWSSGQSNRQISPTKHAEYVVYFRIRMRGLASIDT